MSIAGQEVPAPNVLIAVDVSSSMDANGKSKAAFIAAQALALAIQAVDGNVVGLLFDEEAGVAVNEDATPLFSPRHAWRMDDGTSFHFLNEAWRRWPHHRVLLITDGQGSVPGVLPNDKARTSAIVIPNGDVATMEQIANRVIQLDDLTKLPSVLATLLPRTAVG